ncbi:MAG: hypothetical protein WDW38_003972 [Sanguina aurantia]
MPGAQDHKPAVLKDFGADYQRPSLASQNCPSAKACLARSSRYTKFELLGQGSFKRVYKAFDNVEGIEVAMNEVHMVLPGGCEKVLGQLRHKSIMSLYDWWYDPQGLLIFVTELFVDGTLRQWRRKHKRLEMSVLKRWAWQILSGLVYLHGHEPPIIHRDLKCDNIFVNGTSGVLKIGDLGLATLLGNGLIQQAQSVIGTPEFMAPELYEEHYDQKVDVYSFGLCIMELALLEYPYAECKNAAQIYKKVTQGIAPAGLAKVKNPELHSFISTCICHDPQRRPNARELLKHPFFDSWAPAAAAAAFRKFVLPGSSNSLTLDALRCSSDNATDPLTTPRSAPDNLVPALLTDPSEPAVDPFPTPSLAMSPSYSSTSDLMQLQQQLSDVQPGNAPCITASSAAPFTAGSPCTAANDHQPLSDTGTCNTTTTVAHHHHTSSSTLQAFPPCLQQQHSSKPSPGPASHSEPHVQPRPDAQGKPLAWGGSDSKRHVQFSLPEGSCAWEIPSPCSSPTASQNGSAGPLGCFGSSNASEALSGEDGGSFVFKNTGRSGSLTYMSFPFDLPTSPLRMLSTPEVSVDLGSASTQQEHPSVSDRSSGSGGSSGSIIDYDVLFGHSAAKLANGRARTRESEPGSTFTAGTFAAAAAAAAGKPSSSTSSARSSAQNTPLMCSGGFMASAQHNPSAAQFAASSHMPAADFSPASHPAAGSCNSKTTTHGFSGSKPRPQTSLLSKHTLQQATQPPQQAADAPQRKEQQPVATQQPPQAAQPQQVPAQQQQQQQHQHQQQQHQHHQHQQPPAAHLAPPMTYGEALMSSPTPAISSQPAAAAPGTPSGTGEEASDAEQAVTLECRGVCAGCAHFLMCYVSKGSVLRSRFAAGGPPQQGGLRVPAGEDTSACVAAEMVEALSMSDSEASCIEVMIEQAISGLSKSYPASSFTPPPETCTGAGMPVSAPSYAAVV